MSDEDTPKQADRPYFRRDQDDGVSPPDLTKNCTFLDDRYLPGRAEECHQFRRGANPEVFRQGLTQMDELFSCRNYIQNGGQSLNAGPGSGYCQLHRSVIDLPGATTCKSLHRKDLPQFLVGEGLQDHAYEFALFTGMASLRTKEPVPSIPYSQKLAWEHGQYNSLTNALAQYPKYETSWVFIQAFSGGIDGLRALAHASLVRRYLYRCGTWRSSYRLILSLLQHLDVEPRFEPANLLTGSDSDLHEARTQALWDVIFARIAGIQEYGWHAGLEHLMWITDSLSGALVDLDWKSLRPELSREREVITALVIDHAKANEAFFPQRDFDVSREDDVA